MWITRKRAHRWHAGTQVACGHTGGMRAHRWHAGTLKSMDLVKTRTRCHRASTVMLLAVVKSTTKPRILRNGLTPRTSSSTAHTMVAANERTPSVVFGVPFGILNRRMIDKAMETDNATFGHWATVSPPVRRLTNIHRSASSKFRRAASLRDRIMRRHHGHPAQGCHGQTGAVSPGRTQPSRQLQY